MNLDNYPYIKQLPWYKRWPLVIKIIIISRWEITIYTKEELDAKYKKMIEELDQKHRKIDRQLKFYESRNEGFEIHRGDGRPRKRGS